MKIMNRNFIFIFILLVTLSTIKAIPLNELRKRVTTFEPCAKTPMDVTQIEPDPLVSGAKGIFHVSGKLAKTIPAGYILAALYVDVSTNTPKLIDYNAATICEPEGALACPFLANTPFAITLSGTIPKLPAT